jgi:hypothetical protein
MVALTGHDAHRRWELMLDLGQPLLFELIGCEGPLLRLAAMRSSVMGRVCSEVAYRAGFIFRRVSFPAFFDLGLAPEAELFEYCIIIKSKRSKRADRLAGVIKGFRLCLFGNTFKPRFQLFDLFDC